MAPSGSSSFRVKSRECIIPCRPPDGEAKFWLEPTVTLATYTGLSTRELATAQRVVTRHLQEIIDAWHKHFGG